MKKLLFSAVAALTLMAAAPLAMADAPKQGGQAIITFNNDLTTLDPQVGYDWQNWSVIKSIFDGLMDYKPGTTELEPDLAESYTVSDDGLTYTFTLRDGVKFHNGRPMTSSDVKYSFERAVNPATQSPGGGYFGMIAGYDDVAGGKATTLSGIETPDDKTVIFKLTRPDATFLHLMAINFGYVVPKEEVEKAGADWGKNPVGTGAFKFVEWVPGQSIKLERNKDYYKPNTPYLDAITFEFGQDPTVAVLRLKKGEIDIVGDGIPPAQFAELTADPANKDLIVVGDQLQTGYVTMNVTQPPFDNIKVRQAVNMAINKDRIVRLINNRAAPANQPLPPAMPGYNPDNKGFAYDPEGAKKLLAEAGVGEINTELYVMNVDPNPRIAQAIQQDLAAVGIKAEIRSLAQAEVIAAGGSGKAPMVWSGGMAWIADFPDPANFYYGILGCAGAVEGGWNWSRYCNKALDERAAKADSMVKDDQKDARISEWKAIFDDVTKEAAWAPVFNEKRFTYHSDRLGGDPALFTDPIHIPVNYDYIYAKDAQ
ncbi:MAG: ABC transporter substrate-binding protein [Aestuariivirga sp.]|uniref:ABC transporter substrate-binding protein n=1 Tax=Aestuariivirga sp. TaxID=2650926 RepID=UPI0025BFFE0A|nr:ABC transporter substrate-binding protein [Aestuariivirga sp.]MCA3560842.1 ABC transporter substrate-binding protein [Aestuariivirga sp.]